MDFIINIDISSIFASFLSVIYFGHLTQIVLKFDICVKET